MREKKYDICCIGHLTQDKIITPASVEYLCGGTSFYFSNALQHMDLPYALVTKVADTEMNLVTDLRQQGIEVIAGKSKHTVYFENIYGANPDHRTQRVLAESDPFTWEELEPIEAGIFHLGPLLATDIPVSLIQQLAAKGKLSLDVQGYLREVRGEAVYPIEWAEKKQALPYIQVLKANDEELKTLTGHSDVEEGAKLLLEWGVQEVVVTLGSKGSVIYVQRNVFAIPAYKPEAVVDATGCGDTYMAGYLYQRAKGADILESGKFAAAMATLKIQFSGPFKGTESDVRKLVNNSDG